MRFSDQLHTAPFMCLWCYHGHSNQFTSWYSLNVRQIFRFNIYDSIFQTILSSAFCHIDSMLSCVFKWIFITSLDESITSYVNVYLKLDTMYNFIKNPNKKHDFKTIITERLKTSPFLFDSNTFTLNSFVCLFVCKYLEYSPL